MLQLTKENWKKELTKALNKLTTTGAMTDEELQYLFDTIESNDKWNRDYWLKEKIDVEAAPKDQVEELLFLMNQLFIFTKLHGMCRYCGFIGVKELVKDYALKYKALRNIAELEKEMDQETLSNYEQVRTNVQKKLDDIKAKLIKINDGKQISALEITKPLNSISLGRQWKIVREVVLTIELNVIEPLCTSMELSELNEKVTHLQDELEDNYNKYHKKEYATNQGVDGDAYVLDQEFPEPEKGEPIDPVNFGEVDIDQDW